MSKISDDNCINIRTSTIFKCGERGIESLIVGIKATKARVKVAIVPSLPPNDVSWKKTTSPISPRIQIGMNTVKIVTPGYL